MSLAYDVLPAMFARPSHQQLSSALRQSQQNYEALVNSIEGIVWEADAQTLCFTFVSQQAERLLGYPVKRWIAEPTFWADHLHPADRDWAIQFCQAATRERRSHEFEYRMLAADGRVVWLRDIVRVVAEPDQPLKLRGVMVDVTERRQREWERDLLLKLSTAMRGARTRADMAPIILEHLHTEFNVHSAALALNQPAQDELTIELGLGTWAAWTGQSISARAPRLAHLSLPLTAQGQTLGALWLERSVPLTSAEANVLTALTDLVANALQRVTLHEQTELRLKRLAALYSIEMAITANLDLHSVLNLFLNEVLIHLGVDAADVLLFNPPEQTLEYVIGRGFQQAARFQALPAAVTLARQAVQELRLITLTASSATAEGIPTGDAARFHAEPFAAYYAAPLIAKGQINGVLEIFHRTPLRPDPDWLDFLQTLAGQAAIAIHNAALLYEQHRANADLAQAYNATIAGWSRALDLRDRETEGHAERVTDLTMRLARAIGLPEAELVHIYRGALLHDIGKIGISDNILLKPGPLTAEEWTLMRRHPVYAYELLAPIAYLRPALDIPYCHHERWDGTGYPRQLRGETIPLAARLFTLADVWDALRSDRPYRAGWPIERVRDHIRLGAGSHFDPALVEVFLQLMSDEK